MPQNRKNVSGLPRVLEKL